MKSVVKILYICFSIFLLYYLILPTNNIPPNPPSDFLRSVEPADVETPLRIGYYTDRTRADVIRYYRENLTITPLRILFFYPLELNYPPEEAQILIRDQARSTFLEELTYPMRDSLFINGFKPNRPQDAIIVDSKEWMQKIIVKKINSNRFYRVAIGFMVLGVIPLLYNSLTETSKESIAYIKTLREQ
jgi:hypothetical protein